MDLKNQPAQVYDASFCAQRSPMKPGFHHKADWSWKKAAHQSLFQPLVGVFDSRVLFLFSCQGRDYCSEEEDIT